jgi:hypothetical protein
MPLEFTANEEMTELIWDLASKIPNATPSLVVRRAIALLRTVAESRDHDLFPALIDETGEVQARLVGIFEESE